MDDFIIIGGGIAGISIAAILSKYAKVTLLEAEENLGYHASGRSAAIFIKDYGNESVKALTYLSSEYLEKENGGVLSGRGLLLLAGKEDKDNFVSEYRQLGMEEIPISLASKKIPLLKKGSISKAAFRQDVFDIDTEQLFQNFSKQALKNGASIKKNSEVSRINYNQKNWTVFTSHEEFSSKILINAAGAWVDKIALLAGISPLKFLPCRRSMARVPVPGDYNPKYWPHTLEVNDKFYFKPDAGELLISPAEEEPVEPHDAWANDFIIAEGISRFERFSSKKITRVSTNWAGIRTFSPDRSLVIGFASDNPKFFWLGGQGGYGFQTAPAASKLAKQLLLGEKSTFDKAIIKSVSPYRFKSM